MEPATDYSTDARLIEFRLQTLERAVHELTIYRARQQSTMDKTQRDVDEAHNKLRLLVSRERYKAWTAIATAFTAVVAAIVAFFHNH